VLQPGHSRTESVVSWPAVAGQYYLDIGGFRGVWARVARNAIELIVRSTGAS